MCSHQKHGTGGRAAEGAGLENRLHVVGGDHAKPENKGPSDDRPDPEIEALARRLRRDPDLAEVVDVWALLDEPIRAAIMQLVKVRAR